VWRCGDKRRREKDKEKQKIGRNRDRFLSFGNFYRRFIDHYSDIARPLIELTKKDVLFNWSEHCEGVFQELKRRFTTVPVLITPNLDKPFVLECDASLAATAAVLRQQDANGDWHPVAYLSQTFNPAERNYKIYDRELLAIVRALEQWRHYLEGTGKQVQVFTNHKNLTYFRSPQRLNRRQARWQLFLSQFDLQLVHCPGRQLVQADALTRKWPIHLPDDNVDEILLSRLRPIFRLFFVFFSPALIATAPHTWLSHGRHAEATRLSCSAHSASFASRITGYLVTRPF
jgi:hypothetical protein